MSNAKQELQVLADKLEIADLAMRQAYALDSRDWATFRGLFTERVFLDQSQHMGTPGAEVSAADLAETVRLGVTGFAATQHAVTTVLTDVSGDQATSRAYVHAYHHLPDAGGPADYVLSRVTWRLELRRIDGRWRISTIEITRDLPLEGDPGLYARAAERV